MVSTRCNPLLLLPLQLVFLFASAALLPVGLAFSIRHDGSNFSRRLIISSAKANGVADSYSPIHHTPERHTQQRSKPIAEYDPREVLRRCNTALMAVLASAAISMVCPSPSVASTQCNHQAIIQSEVMSSSVVVSLSASDLSSINPSSISELGLKPATEEKPQILPAKSMQQRTDTNSGRVPILQGLVYFPQKAPTDPAVKVQSGPQVKEQLDYYSDILVLTAVSATEPNGPVLAGAKFPVSSVRFPFSFQMFKENLLTSKPGVSEGWDKVATTGDVILRARICPSDAPKFPCEDNETKKSAEGVAKLVTNLPGLPEGGTIRAPASLALL